MPGDACFSPPCRAKRLSGNGAFGPRGRRQNALWLRCCGIYYFHSELMPLYLLTLFAKSERANFSNAERNELAALVDMLVAAWMDR